MEEDSLPSVEVSFPAGGILFGDVRQDCAFEFFEIGVAAVAGKAGYRRFRASDASCHIPDAHADEILRTGNDIIDQFFSVLVKCTSFFAK